MQQFTVDSKSDGKKLVRLILTRFPALDIVQVRKALRGRDIRVNDQRQKTDTVLFEGDVVSVYLPDSAFKRTQQAEAGQPLYQVVHQDSQLIIVNKRPGVTVHGAGSSQGPYLIDQMRIDFDQQDLQLCHRLDRHTGGLLLVARNPKTLEFVQKLLRGSGLVKRYRCLVKGVPDQGKPVRSADGLTFMELEAYLEKIASKSDVYIHDRKQTGDLDIITRYRVLKTFPGAGPNGESISELEVELVTGRTHQIRAHLAHIDHPILGDGKYGRNSFNRHFKRANGSIDAQQLFATTLLFQHQKNGPLANLAGRTVSIEPTYDWIGYR